MRWIHKNEKISRGEGDPPESGGALFFVDGNGSKTLVNDVLYLDGKPAPQGTHEIKMKNGRVLSIDVDQNGKAKRRKEGGKTNGGTDNGTITSGGRGNPRK